MVASMECFITSLELYPATYNTSINLNIFERKLVAIGPMVR